MMKTKELARLLKPLSPCLEGLKGLRQNDTVAQWWRRCRSANHLFYVWSFVATADTDDVFANELTTGINEKFNVFYMADDILYRRALPYPVICDCWLSGLDGFATAADKFRSVFRCPTDAELRMAGRFFAKKVEP